MNTLGLALIWTALQVTIFCVAGSFLYFVARRRHPARGAAALCGVLLTTVGIAALSFSPWPRWWTMADERHVAREPRGEMQAVTTDHVPPASIGVTAADLNEVTSEKSAAPATVDVLNALSGIWGRVRRQVNDGESANRQASRWQWPAWLAAIVLAGMGIGLARLLLGWIALGRLLRETRRVDDPVLLSLLEQLCLQLHCRRRIEVREMVDARSHGSPAVVGWRRPLILLPADWREWSLETRQVILAHETAHVAHGDFLMWVGSQWGVILHFYNPIVHWLAHQLRLEQELAADLCGAALAGGSKSYVTVLAKLALAQDEPRPLWAGRPFFPTRGTLMRRIEMLRHQRSVTESSPSKAWPAALLLALALIGLGVAGLRGPTGAARAAEPQTESQGTEKKSAEAAGANAAVGSLPTFESSYLPAETIAVLSLKPLKLANSEVVVQPTFLQFPQAFGLGFGTRSQNKDEAWEIEEVKAVVLAPAASRAPISDVPASKSASADASDSRDPPAVFIYRMRLPFDQNKIRVKIFGEAPDGVTELTLHGRKCFQATSEVSGDVINYLLVDDRTVAIMRDKDMAVVLAADSKGHPKWHGRWQEIANSPLALAADSESLLAVMTESKNENEDAADKFIESILRETTFISGHVASTAEGLQISATARCASPDKAEAMSKRVGGWTALGLMVVPNLVEPSTLAKEYETLDIQGALIKTLSSTSRTVNILTREVHAEATIGAEFAARFVEASEALLKRDTEAMNARAKEEDQAHQAKLGQLINALNAYHAARGHYPASVVLGPDGKSAHSWRVELLPYLGEQKLFDSYKLDEPWDSQHNKTLIEKVPAIYSTSTASPKGTSDYFVVTGPGTLFDGDAAPRRESITDAAGETILVLQSRRHIPWTKPADIELPANNTPVNPARGHKNGFYGGFADGSVRLIPRNTPQATIQAMFTKAGGEEVKLR